MSDNQDAMFEAAFAEARGDELPTDRVNSETEVEDAVDTQDSNGDDEESVSQDDAVEALAKLPELENMTQAEIRKIYGKFGEMQQAINSIKSQSATQPGKGKVVVTEAFREEYPELAEMMEGFEVQGSMSGNNNYHEESETKFNAQMQTVKNEFETKLLTLQHDDWKEVANSQAFNEWVNKQDAETQQTLSESWDASYISRKLTEFKKTAPKDKATTLRNNNARLEDAVTPKGGQSTPRTVSDTDAFEAGFKKVRSGT